MSSPHAPETRRSALFGLAEHVWRPERARWILRPRPARIAGVATLLLAGLYFSAAWLKYAENKWIRDCDNTAYAEICLFIFPDKIPWTGTVWVPGWLHDRIERARDSHRAKLAETLMRMAKSGRADQRKALQSIFGATKLNPHNQEARLLASRALFALRRDDDAMEALEEALPELIANREFVREYIITGYIRERYARLLAVSLYHISSPATPPETRAAFLVAAALCHFERGEYEKCAQICANPSLARTREAFTLRVRMLRELGKSDEALALISAACAQNPDDAELAGTRIELAGECGDPADARNVASLQTMRAPNDPRARLRMIEQLNPATEREHFDDLVASYRRDFSKSPEAMIRLCEYAAVKGMTGLCADILHEAEAAKNASAQRMRLLFIESHLAQRRYPETVRLVDELFVENPGWLAHSRLQFDALRMVAHFALGREDTGEIGFKRIRETAESLPPRFMEVVARRLIEAQRNAEAIRVIGLCLEKNPDSPAALTALVTIHLEAGGTTDTPARLRQYLAIKRPTRKTLLLARRVIAGDAYYFDPERDGLIHDLEMLLAGTPVIKEVQPLAPKKR